MGINRILLPSALALAVVSIFRRKEAIGGWLLYFYFWICALLIVYLEDILSHYRVFLPSFQLDEEQHTALIAAAYPRLFAMTAIVATASALLWRREWVWVERLRLVFGVTILISAVSLALDLKYFPKAFGLNLKRWIMLCVWFTYLCVSRRVHEVFQTKTWGKTTY